MGFLKFFRFGSDSDDKQEVVDLPEVKRTYRIGMDKRFAVGRVKHVSQDRKHLLIDTMEMSYQDDGSYKTDTYNLWLYCGPEWKSSVSKNLLGHYIVFGFYIQSFRNKDLADSYTTVLTCKFLNALPNRETAISLGIDLSESRQFVDHDYLKLSKINLKSI